MFATWFHQKWKKTNTKVHTQIEDSIFLKMFFGWQIYIKIVKEASTFEDIVGSIAFRACTRLPFLQKVRFARGNSKPESVQRHLTSGPILSITSNLTIPPSTRSSSPTFTSATYENKWIFKISHNIYKRSSTRISSQQTQN